MDKRWLPCHQSQHLPTVIHTQALPKDLSTAILLVSFLICCPSKTLESIMTPPYPAPVTEWHNDTYDAINPRQPELSQAGRTVVVAGAGQGIGQEIVDVFAQAESAVIHIIGRTPQTIAETKNIVEKRHPNVKVVVHVADIVDTAAVEKAAREIGPWDVIVANAGYIPGPDRIEDSDPEEWWKTFEVRPFFPPSLRYLTQY